jgi:hypothetical protein
MISACSGCGKVMAAVVSTPVVTLVNKTQVRLVDQGRCLKRLSRLLLSELLHRLAAQLLLD